MEPTAENTMVSNKPSDNKNLAEEDNEKIRLLAIDILEGLFKDKKHGDAFYFYRNTKKSTHKNLLHHFYIYLSKMFKCSERDVQRAVDLLKEFEVVKINFREFKLDGVKLIDVAFLEFDENVLKSMKYPSPSGLFCPYHKTNVSDSQKL